MYSECILCYIEVGAKDALQASTRTLKRLLLDHLLTPIQKPLVIQSR